MQSLTDGPVAPSDVTGGPAFQLSACIEMLFRVEQPGGLRDRLLAGRDLLTERGPSPAAAIAAARLLVRPGESDPYPARIRACKALGGVDAVEFWSWRNKDAAAIERALDETGLALAAFLSEPVGRLVDRRTHADFLAGLRDSLVVARRLRARSLIVVAGDTLPEVDRGEQRAALVAALTAAAPLAEDAGITLILEPLNSQVDHRATFLDRTAEGLAVIADVGRPGVRLLYDVYHSVTMGEDPERLFDGGLGALVGHVHVADSPGRREPGSGSIAWDRALLPLSRNGYAGAIGLEFRPSRGRTTAAMATAAMVQVRSAAASIARSVPRGGAAGMRPALRSAQGGLR